MFTPDKHKILFLYKDLSAQTVKRHSIESIRILPESCISPAWKLEISMKYCLKTLEIIRKLKDRYYNSENNTWTITLNPYNLNILRNLPLPVSVFDQMQSYCSSKSFSSELDTIGTTEKSPIRSEHTDISLGKQTKETALLHHMGNSDAGAIPIKQKIRDLSIQLQGKFFFIRIPYLKSSINTIKSLKGSWWCRHRKAWQVPAALDTLKKLQDSFLYWDEADLGRLYAQVDNLHHVKETIIIYQNPAYKNSILIKLEGSHADFQFIKSLPQRKYDATSKRWILPDDKVLVDRIVAHFKGRNAEVQVRLPDNSSETGVDRFISTERKHYLHSRYNGIFPDELKSMIDKLIQMRYSEHTIRLYCNEIIFFFKQLQDKRPGEVSSADVNRYLKEMATNPVSDSKMHAAINAIKFYYNQVDYKDDFYVERIRRPKSSKKLPHILSLSEIDSLLRALDNLKHSILLCVLYSSGLRKSEVLNLQIKDILWDRDQLFIKGAKGKKDRYVMLSSIVKGLLQTYFDTYRPINYVFEGQYDGRPYSSKSVQNIVKKAAARAGISKNVYPHLLRHCFATHLADGGTPIKYIQELLGHKDIKTTNPTFVSEYRNENLIGKKMMHFVNAA